MAGWPHAVVMRFHCLTMISLPLNIHLKGTSENPLGTYGRTG
jgi:hypothetical protein